MSSHPAGQRRGLQRPIPENRDKTHGGRTRADVVSKRLSSGSAADQPNDRLIQTGVKVSAGEQRPPPPGDMNWNFVAVAGLENTDYFADFVDCITNCSLTKIYAKYVQIAANQIFVYVLKCTEEKCSVCKLQNLYAVYVLFISWRERCTCYVL